MKLYAESSAPLAWLLEQEHGELVANTLAQAELVIASDLTVIECDRVLIRAVVLDELEESDAVDRQARLNAVSERWTLLGLDEEIIERARRPFPAEPVRTLDTIHVASALTARRAVPDLAMLALDGRVRKAADRLGFCSCRATQNSACRSCLSLGRNRRLRNQSLVMPANVRGFAWTHGRSAGERTRRASNRRLGASSLARAWRGLPFSWPFGATKPGKPRQTAAQSESRKSLASIERREWKETRPRAPEATKEGGR